MSLQELQKYTAVSKYARWLEKEKRRETWEETVDRSRQMMLDRYPEVSCTTRWAYDKLEKLEVLGSQRVLQYAGKPILQHNTRAYNCCTSYCDRLRFFQEAFYLLLCGSGVGFSVQKRHARFLPNFSPKRRKGVTLPKRVFRPDDSIEGWANTTGVLLSSYHEAPIRGFEAYHDCEVEFDLSAIRPAGSALSFGIGKAPGPGPLRVAIERKRLLLNYLVTQHKGLRSVDAFDLVMHDSDAVLSGGVRRSASICIFDGWDTLMAEAKTGNWLKDNPQRARANISALLPRGSTSFEQFAALFRHTREWGEPGVYWADHHDCVPNPCVETGMFCRLPLRPGYKERLNEYDGPFVPDEDDGTPSVSGWQFCNLSTVPGKTVRSVTDFHDRCVAASVIGTLQAGFTNFPYLGWVSEEITKREALLGVSICGIMHHPEILLDPKVLREGVRLIRETNRWVAEAIGINPSARLTCIKPDGNSASLLGSFSGVGYGKIRRGFRIVQANRLETPYQHFRSVNPSLCEKSVWGANNADDVIRFPVEYEGLIERDHTAIQALENVRVLYENWVLPGTVKDRRVKPWLTHSVSNTISVRPHEWEEVARHVYQHRESYAGVSFLSSMGDLDYYQAPFTSVLTTDEVTRKYSREAVTEGLWLVEQASVFPNLWDACDFVLGRKTDEKDERQQRWAVAFGRYRAFHFGGDGLLATYCLKDLFNNRLYEHLSRVIKPVDYSEMVEENATTNMVAEISCTGGLCEL